MSQWLQTKAGLIIIKLPNGPHPRASKTSVRCWILCIQRWHLRLLGSRHSAYNLARIWWEVVISQVHVCLQGSGPLSFLRQRGYSRPGQEFLLSFPLGQNRPGEGYSLSLPWCGWYSSCIQAEEHSCLTHGIIPGKLWRMSPLNYHSEMRHINTAIMRVISKMICCVILAECDPQCATCSGTASNCDSCRADGSIQTNNPACDAREYFLNRRQYSSFSYLDLSVNSLKSAKRRIINNYHSCTIEFNFFFFRSGEFFVICQWKNCFYHIIIKYKLCITKF